MMSRRVPENAYELRKSGLEYHADLSTLVTDLLFVALVKLPVALRFTLELAR